MDAGIGKPSHAVQVMEFGFDGVLLNTAVALAQQPLPWQPHFAMRAVPDIMPIMQE